MVYSVFYLKYFSGTEGFSSFISIIIYIKLKYAWILQFIFSTSTSNEREISITWISFVYYIGGYTGSRL